MPSCERQKSSGNENSTFPLRGRGGAEETLCANRAAELAATIADGVQVMGFQTESTIDRKEELGTLIGRLTLTRN
jgi:hypothetical protein